MAELFRGVRIAPVLSILVLAVFSGGCAASPETPAVESTSRVFTSGSSTTGSSTDAAIPTPKSSAVADPTMSLRPARQIKEAWDSYPWGPDDGLACSPPSTSSGHSLDPAGPGVVVIIGDSLIRESRDALNSALGDAGYGVVFICWGGKNLSWGLEQVDTMKSLRLMPTCLVVNLGTNDLKGTTAQGLSDAVPLGVVTDRLTELLLSLQEVDDVFVVDLAAELTLAPSTMAEAAKAPDAWEAAVEQTGVGAAVPWATEAAKGGLIGSDGIHDSADGQVARAQLITAYVMRDCS